MTLINQLPRISMITPSYNQGAFLDETIRSVLDQGYANLEYIVIDGASTDESVEIIRKYEPELAYWISEADTGQSDALNKGFAKATGDIICWINSDDRLMPGVLDRVARHFTENPESIWCGGGCKYIDEHGFAMGDISILPDTGLASWLTHIKYRKGIFLQPSTFWRAEAMHQVGMLREDMHYAFDFEFFYRLRKHFGPQAKLDGVLSEFRVHGASKTVSASEMFLLEMLDMARTEMNELPSDQRAVVQAWLHDERAQECFLEQQRALEQGDHLGHWRWRIRGWIDRLRTNKKTVAT